MFFRATLEGPDVFATETSGSGRFLKKLSVVCFICLSVQPQVGGSTVGGNDLCVNTSTQTRFAKPLWRDGVFLGTL